MRAVARFDQHILYELDGDERALARRRQLDACLDAQADDYTLTEGHALVRGELRGTRDTVPQPPAHHVFEVTYDGDDLTACAAALGIDAKRLVELHTAPAYDVSFTGFVPGFAYLRGLASPLGELSRRDTARTRVPARSVAIAAGMTAIYPFDSPGGWWLLGTAHRDPLEVALRIGDSVRFVACTTSPPDPPQPLRAVLEQGVDIESVGLAWVVDGVGMRRLRDGIGPGGPLVRYRAELANASVGNPQSAGLLECLGPLRVRSALGTKVRVASHLGTHALRAGDSLAIPSLGREAHYVAFEGGVVGETFRGGRGTLLALRRGGHEGRPLRRGDRVAIGRQRGSFEPTEPAAIRRLRLSPGPAFEAHRDRVGAQLEGSFTIAPASDRTGIRLHPEIAPTGRGAREPSMPMLRGAVQLLPNGEWIVFGPDHPITGGYPWVATLSDADLDALFAMGPGATLRFDRCGM